MKAQTSLAQTTASARSPARKSPSSQSILPPEPSTPGKPRAKVRASEPEFEHASKSEPAESSALSSRALPIIFDEHIFQPGFFNFQILYRQRGKQLQKRAQQSLDAKAPVTRSQLNHLVT